MNTIKTVGMCNKIINATRGCKGMFEYQIEGIKYNVESDSHIGWLKEGNKYNIYVKNNHEVFVAKKVLVDLLFFVILFGIIFLVESIGLLVCT